MYFFPQEFTVMFYLITPNISGIVLGTCLKGCLRARMGGEGNSSLTEGKGRHSKQVSDDYHNAIPTEGNYHPTVIYSSVFRHSFCVSSLSISATAALTSFMLFQWLISLLC